MGKIETDPKYNERNYTKIFRAIRNKGMATLHSEFMAREYCQYCYSGEQMFQLKSLNADAESAGKRTHIHLYVSDCPTCDKSSRGTYLKFAYPNLNLEDPFDANSKIHTLWEGPNAQ